MKRENGPRGFAILFAAALANSMMPGCNVTLGRLPEEDSAGTETGEDTAQQDPQAPEQTPEEEPEDAFAQVDPQQLALAEAKAALTTAYLVATVESAGLDPSTLDESAIEQLMEQFLPAAAAEADAWLATLDPSMLSASFEPRIQCKKEHGCAYLTQCKYNAPPIDHNCWVTDCGKSRCSLCPDWVADLLQSLVLTSWCAYVCTENGTHNVVAIGAGGISRFKGDFVGPICKAP
ncbi:hypothetical protein [Sorangium cellulosum]|uniref:Uncharacterized protein n=1 Tax=Sorangium cellulosum So0157-2 TaxID=1254432 RepID=S4XVG2_SORCE|nr:hypothetical protein [Sorangium cellulosum]AGP34588.1 hypothetical protein SCE1572_08750 [Sorangium cellulosum So0157-2]